MAVVKSPYFKVTYEGVDITNDLTDSVLSISYSDAVEGESDEIRLVLHDFHGKWKSEWRSNNGDKISLQIGYSEDNLLDCGTFEIDEIHYKGQPDTVEISALAIGSTNTLRDFKSRVFENQTIRQIAQRIADENDLNLSYGLINAGILAPSTSIRVSRIEDMIIQRCVQDREPDLAFLNRIANKFGLIFNVRGSEMYYYLIYDIETVDPTNQVIYETTDLERDVQDRSETAIQMKDYDLKDCAEKVVAGVDVIYDNPFNGNVYVFGTSELPTYAELLRRNDAWWFKQRKRLKVYVPVENDQQAEIVAEAALYKSVSRQVEGDINMEGSPKVVAGTAFNVEGLGWLSGRYFVQKSHHQITRAGGYTTRAEVKLLGDSTTSQP